MDCTYLIPASLRTPIHPLHARFLGHIKIRDLASFCGYSPSTVSQWLLGYRAMPDFIETALTELADKIDIMKGAENDL